MKSERSDQLWYKQEMRLEFPLTVAVGMSFESREEVKNYLSLEANDRHLAFCTSMYDSRKAPSTHSFRCKIC